MPDHPAVTDRVGELVATFPLAGAWGTNRLGDEGGCDMRIEGMRPERRFSTLWLAGEPPATLPPADLAGGNFACAVADPRDP